MGYNGNVIETGDFLHVAQPHLLAVLGVVGALIRYAVLRVLVVILKGEAHAVDVASTDQLQRIVGVVSLRKVTAAVDAVTAKFQRQRVLVRVAVTPQHVGHHVRVVQVENHVRLLQQFAADATRLQNLIHLTSG